MLLAALEAGAAAAGDWSECHATPVDADCPEFGDLDLGAATNRLSYPYGVMVNLRGERFADEGEDFKLYTYAKMGTAIMHQPHALAIQIYRRAGGAAPRGALRAHGASRSRTR